MRNFPMLVLIVLLASACGDEAGQVTSTQPTPTSTSTTAETTTTSTTTTSTTSTTLAPTTTVAPTTTAPTLSADIIFEAWKSVFEDSYVPLYTASLPEALEDDFYWVDSVDRVAYDPVEFSMTIEATIDYESVYANDLEEWQDDTWTLYRDFAHVLWAATVEGFEEGMTGDDVAVKFETDWPTWTPRLTLMGNLGALSVSCPGALVYAVSERQATQLEFIEECDFVN